MQNHGKWQKINFKQWQKIASKSRRACSNIRKDLNKITNHKYRKEQNEVKKMELALKNEV